jgi:hypothetical protein
MEGEAGRPGATTNRRVGSVADLPELDCSCPAEPFRAEASQDVGGAASGNRGPECLAKGSLTAGPMLPQSVRVGPLLLADA